MTQKPFGRKNMPFHRMNVRLPMKPLHDLVLEMNDGKYHRLSNISIGGVGLFPDSFDLGENKAFKAFLNVGKKRITVEFEVAHRSAEIVGCRFKNPSPELRSAIESFFETEIKGLKLTRAEKLSSKSVEGEKTTFYRSQNNCEVVVLEKSAGLVSFSITLFGNYIEYDHSAGLVVAQSFEKGSAQNGVSLFRKVENPGSDLIHVALKLVNRIEGLSVPVGAKIVQVLSDGLKGMHINEPQTEGAP